jgi:hypothetical protein
MSQTFAIVITSAIAYLGQSLGFQYLIYRDHTGGVVLFSYPNPSCFVLKFYFISPDPGFAAVQLIVFLRYHVSFRCLVDPTSQRESSKLCHPNFAICHRDVSVAHGHDHYN